MTRKKASPAEKLANEATENVKHAVKAVQAVAVKEAPQVDPFMLMIQQAATDKNTDVAKMREMYDMMKDFKATKAAEAFNEAMNKVQRDMPRVKKNGMIDIPEKDGKAARKTSFAKYEDVDKVIRSRYEAEGFSLRFNTEWNEAGALIFLKVCHIGGHVETLSMRLPLDSGPGRNNLQAMGSTISYGRRYLTEMAFNIIREGVDDDGAGADGKITIEQAVQFDLDINALPDAKAYKPKFLAYMKVESVQDIKEKDFQKAVNALNAKKNPPKQPEKAA